MERDGLWVPARRGMTIGLVLLVTLVAFEALAVNTALPEASRELGGLGLYGWVFSAFMLSTVASIAVSGRAIDQRGLYPVLAIGAPLFCIGLLIGATAPSMVVLVAARVVQGLGAGAISSVANVSIGRAYPPKLRPKMLAVMSSSWVVPGLVGPSVSALITEAFGWRWVFAALIPIVGGAALLTLPALRPFGPTAGAADAADGHRTTDPLRVAISIGFVIGGLSNAHDVWPLVFIPFGLAIATPALRRLSPAGTFRITPGPPAAIVLNFVLNFAFFSTDAFLPLAVKEVRGRGVGIAGLALTTGAITWTAGSWLTARNIERFSVTTRVRAGCGFVATGVAIVLFGLTPGVPIVIFPIAWAFAGFGMGLAYQGLVLVVLGDGEGDADGPVGSLVAARQIFDTLGTAMGAGAAGACVAIATASNHTTRSGLTVTFVIMVAVALVGVALSGRMEPQSAPVDEAPASLP